MKIAFFEIEEWEIPILEAGLGSNKAVFYKEPLSMSNVSKAADADIVSVFVYSKITSQLINKMPKLRYITTRSMGTDHIDVDACNKAKIKVSNAPHYGDNSVAEHTFGLILALSRNIHKAYLREVNKNYSIDGLKGFDLKGKTLGVIGTGRIGSHVVKIANGFEMNVIAYDCNPNKELIKKYKCMYVSIDKLLSEADIVTLHVPYCKENHHLIGKKEVAMMKPSAVLINTARGLIVDTPFVLSALKSGKLAGLGIDVLEGEELIKEEKELLHEAYKLNLKKMRELAIDHELLNNEKVVFTPHIAFYSEEAVKRILDVTLENINSFAKGKAINLVC